jgi:hypothetical protein
MWTFEIEGSINTFRWYKIGRIGLYEVINIYFIFILKINKIYININVVNIIIEGGW